MSFTILDGALIGFITFLIGIIIALFPLTRKFQTRDECEAITERLQTREVCGLERSKCAVSIKGERRINTIEDTSIKDSIKVLALQVSFLNNLTVIIAEHLNIKIPKNNKP